MMDQAKKEETRILMMGLDNAGKTSILYRLAGDVDNKATCYPTRSFNVETVTPREGVSLTIWDIGGHAHVRVLKRHYYHDADGLVYVVDSSDRARFDESRQDFQTILQVNETRKVPIVIVANKQDVTGAASPSVIAEEFQLSALPDRDWCIHGICAKTGDGLNEAVTEFITYVDRFKKKQ